MVARPFSGAPTQNKQMCALGFACAQGSASAKQHILQRALLANICVYTIRYASCELHFVTLDTQVILPIRMLVASADKFTFATGCNEFGYFIVFHCLYHCQSNTFSNRDRIVIGIVSQPNVRTTKTVPLLSSGDAFLFVFATRKSLRYIFISFPCRNVNLNIIHFR